MLSMSIVLVIMAVMLALLYILVIAMIFVQHMERKDLYTRIMSKSLAEYNRDDTSVPKQPRSAHDKVLERWRKGSDNK